MTAMVTHLSGKHSCAHRREGDSETTRPEDVTCPRCRHAACARAAEIVGPQRVLWVAEVFGWLPGRAA